MNPSSTLWLRRGIIVLCAAYLASVGVVLFHLESKADPYYSLFDILYLYGQFAAFPLFTLLPWQRLPRWVGLLCFLPWMTLGAGLLFRNTNLLLARYSHFNRLPSLSVFLAWLDLVLVFTLNLIWMRMIGILQFSRKKGATPRT